MNRSASVSLYNTPNYSKNAVKSKILNEQIAPKISFVEPRLSVATSNSSYGNKKTPKKKATKLAGDFGIVLDIIDGVAKVAGLDSALAGEMVSFLNNVKGMIISLEKQFVKVLVFGNDLNLGEGDPVSRTFTIVSVTVKPSLIGHTLDALGNIIDDLPNTNNLEVISKIPARTSAVDIKAPGVISRSKINEPVDTGLLFIDTIVPIGRGQRELIIGDKQTGKSAVAIDAIINAKFLHDKSTSVSKKYPGLFCIYVAVGQKRSSIVKMVNKFVSLDAMFYTVVISATASDAASLQYIAPYTGSTFGEWFRDNGLHSLIVFDDLSKHAVAYRQMSLLLRRPSSREAYPGDVFYLHSRLLERAAKLNHSLGSGSLTALPIIETQLGDVSALVATNVISITDGQIYLDSELFNKGIRPAVSAGISVSRVGASAQYKAIRKFAGQLKLELAQYREVELFSAFASELDEATQMTLKRGLRLLDILKQPRFSPLSRIQQLVLVFGGIRGYFDNLSSSDAIKFKNILIYNIENVDKAWFANIDLDQELEEKNLDFYVNTLYKEFSSTL